MSIFPQEGNYEVKVYKYDDNEIFDDNGLETKQIVDIIDEAHLATVYPFLVLYTKI